MQLENKIALVTGSAHRLGREIALGLARQGCAILLHYHKSEDAAEKTIAEIRALGVKAELAQADLSNTQGIQMLFQILDNAFAGLDILINSAAIMQRIGMRSVQEEDWDRTININLRAPFFCLQMAAERMQKRPQGVVINLGDIIGVRPNPSYPVHSIAKTGVQALTEVAALAYAPHIRVNAIAPGLVLKPDEMRPARWQSLSEETPIQRSGKAQDVVDAVLFLCRSEYITGETLVVDGGMQLL